MTDERWHEVIGHIKDTFNVLEEGRHDRDGMPGFTEFVCFIAPGDKKMKLERVTHPLVTGKKTFGSRRIGGSTAVEYEYSDTEMVHKIYAWEWDGITQLWKEVRSENFL